MREFNVTVLENRKVKHGKIQVNAFENNSTRITVTLPELCAMDGLFRYIILKKGELQFAVPLDSEFAYYIGQSITRYAGVWYAIIMVTEQELDKQETDISHYYFMSDIFPIGVRANVLSSEPHRHDAVGQDIPAHKLPPMSDCCLALPPEPNIIRIKDDITQLMASLSSAEDQRVLNELRREQEFEEIKHRAKNNYELYVEVCEENGTEPLSKEEWLESLGVADEDLEKIGNQVTNLQEQIDELKEQIDEPKEQIDELQKQIDELKESAGSFAADNGTVLRWGCDNVGLYVEAAEEQEDENE